jgi:type II secretion system protein F
MPEFKYTALDKQGKQITGTLGGKDQSDAIGKVRSMGYFPVAVQQQGKQNGNGHNSGSKFSAAILERPRAANKAGETIPKTAEVITAVQHKKVNRIQILLFTRELADLIDAGLPIDRALTVLIEQTDQESVKVMVQLLQEDIRAGKPLSEALQRFPKEFPTLFANMIRAGEVSGQLAEVMTRLADFMEKEQVRRSQLTAALTYPVVLVTIAITAVTFLLTFVIPRLQNVFKDLGAALPLPTQMLLAISGTLTHYWWIFGICIASFIFGFRFWGRTTSGKYAIDKMQLNFPLVGSLAKKIVMARFSRTLGTLLGGGVPILDAMQIASTAVGNVVTARAVETARDHVRQGDTLAGSLSDTEGFLPLIVHMTAVGEETGRLPAMLLRTANTLDFEVDNAMRKLTSLVEPLVVLLMGCFVGFIVLSILLPIFQVNSLVK